jgi:SAM-dependent methyltransferase
VREELELNREHWNRAAEIHTTGNTYGIDDFKSGQCRLHRVEVEEVGDVRGKSLLHLQCHFGIDTLSWARRGATVTGVDFSPTAIRAARRLSAESGVPGEFILSDIDHVRDSLPGPVSFDVVFTSYGVICWLPDLTHWAEAVAHYLKPGGFFYIVEAHPTARMFPTEVDLPLSNGELRPFLGYFHNPSGSRWPGGPDYADPNITNPLAQHDWQHSLADVINALISNGLTIEFLHEFPYCAWPVIAGCVEVERFSASHGYHGLPKSLPQMPLMFSLKATKRA